MGYMNEVPLSTLFRVDLACELLGKYYLFFLPLEIQKIIEQTLQGLTRHPGECQSRAFFDVSQGNVISQNTCCKHNEIRKTP